VILFRAVQFRAVAVPELLVSLPNILPQDRMGIDGRGAFILQ
jgi:hypothetical protein